MASAELALYHGKFGVAMETTIADHLAQGWHPLSVFLFLANFLALVYISREKQRRSNSVKEVAKMQKQML